MQLSEKKEKDNNLNRMMLSAKRVLGSKGCFNEQAEVILVLDISGSMSNHFQSGNVQTLVERMLAIALNFDPDGQISIIAFGRNAHDCGVVGRENYHECIKPAGRHTYSINGNVLALEGGTSYAPPFDMALSQTFGSDWRNLNNGGSRGFFGFGKKKGNGRPSLSAPATHPTFVLFITDGECNDARDTTSIVADSSNLPLFTQFAGLGRERFHTLRSLDNLEGRFIDNAGLFFANDVHMPEEQLFGGMLNEFPTYIREARAKGIIR